MLRKTTIENGAVRGLPGTDARITVYKGIPFAKPPVGENRWRAPQPAEDWEGERLCAEFGAIPMQRVPGRDPNAFYAKEWHVDPQVPMSEDCLTANVWTPAKSADEKLPVMVWIHGGGLQEGYSFEMEFDGERIASRGVVLVSLGYRLNVFGFLAHPEITAQQPDAPANFGLMDQTFGLAWVKRNVAAFGGDPDNITIFGQSAGGLSVEIQMCTPQSDGLFQKAIVQSIGGIRAQYPISRALPRAVLTDAEKLGEKLFSVLGVKSLEEARQLDASTVLNAYNDNGFMFGYVIDGRYLDKTVEEYVYDNDLHQVGIIVGNTTDEFPVKPEGETEAEIDAWVDRAFGPWAEDYKALVKKMPGNYAENATVGQMALGNRMMANECAKQGRPIYYYQFGPTIPGDDAGAFHSSDLWFEFETLMRCWRPFDGHHYDLARKMCNYWTNFAKTGNPNGKDADGSEMPVWNPYTLEQPYGICFFDEISMEQGPLSEKEQFLLSINKNTEKLHAEHRTEIW